MHHAQVWHSAFSLRSLPTVPNNCVNVTLHMHMHHAQVWHSAYSLWAFIVSTIGVTVHMHHAQVWQQPSASVVLVFQPSPTTVCVSLHMHQCTGVATAFSLRSLSLLTKPNNCVWAYWAYTCTNAQMWHSAFSLRAFIVSTIGADNSPGISGYRQALHWTKKGERKSWLGGKVCWCTWVDSTKAQAITHTHTLIHTHTIHTHTHLCAGTTPLKTHQS